MNVRRVGQQDRAALLARAATICPTWTMWYHFGAQICRGEEGRGAPRRVAGWPWRPKQARSDFPVLPRGEPSARPEEELIWRVTGCGS